MNFFLAALGVLGVASSGPLIAATLGATSVSALAIAFWRNAIGAVVMAGPVLVRDPRQFGRVTGREFRWSLAGRRRPGAALRLLHHLPAADVRCGGHGAGLPAVRLDRHLPAVPGRQAPLAGPGGPGHRLRRRRGHHRLRHGHLAGGAAGRPPGGGWRRPGRSLHAGRRQGAPDHGHGRLHDALLRHVRGHRGGAGPVLRGSRWQGSKPPAGSASWPSRCARSWWGTPRSTTCWPP